MSQRMSLQNVFPNRTESWWPLAPKNFLIQISLIRICTYVICFIKFKLENLSVTQQQFATVYDVSWIYQIFPNELLAFIILGINYI